MVKTNILRPTLRQSVRIFYIPAAITPTHHESGYIPILPKLIILDLATATPTYGNCYLSGGSWG